MRTIEELKAFCEGYARAMPDYDKHSADEWVVWGGYDVNIAGGMYTSYAQTDTDLRVDAYKAGWTESIGDPIHSFTVTATN